MEHLVKEHLGGYYISNKDPKTIEKHCDECNDNDSILLSWEDGKKMEALLSFFSITEEEITNLLDKYNTNKHIINILRESKFITYFEKIKLLKQNATSLKKQLLTIKNNINSKVKRI